MNRSLLAISVAFASAAAGFWFDRRREQTAWRPPPLDASSPHAGSDSHRLPETKTPISTVHRLIESESEPPAIRFVDSAAESGIGFVYFDGAHGEYQIFETTGGGVAAFDADLDGHQDLFFTNGAETRSHSLGAIHYSAFYARRGGEYLELGSAAGLALTIYGHGACANDFDNDGFSDLFLTGLHQTKLMRNNGDGTFDDVTVAAGVHASTLTTSAAMADLDSDGDLDLFVATYAHVSLEKSLDCRRNGRRIHCDPRNYNPQEDHLFLNRGDGTFQDESRAVACGEQAGRGFGVVIADFDEDSQLDIFVANDMSTNHLFLNRGGRHFEEAAVRFGCAVSNEGRVMAGMGVACADYDHNGLLDLFVTNFYRDKNVLFAGFGSKGFLDRSDDSLLGHSSYDRLGWGALFLDAELDGRLDLFVANGHVSDRGDEPYRMRPQFYRNLGNGRFDELTDLLGPFFQKPELGRGAACVDLDDDGRIDIVCCHIGRPAGVLMNRTDPIGRWFGLELIGRRSCRDAVSAVIRVRTSEGVRRYDIVGGGAFLSSSDRRIVVGLGNEPVPTNVEISWPSGLRQTVEPREHQYRLVVEPL